MTTTKTYRLFIPGILLCLTLCISSNSYSQSKLDSLFNKLDPQKFAASLNKKAEKLEEKLIAKSQQTLDKLQRQEEKIYRKLLTTKDSLQAKVNLDELKSRYAELKDKIKNPAIISTVKQYIPTLDSFSTSLKFLNESGVGGKVKDALVKTASLQEKFQQAEEIKKFIKERREQLKQHLEKLGLAKQLKQFNKQVYYYAAQINEYKEILQDPKRIEKKALELLSKTKFYQEFFRKNSMLASLFPMPEVSMGGGAGQNGFAGLQTRSQMISFIQNNNGVNAPVFASTIQKNIQSAQGVVDQLRSKLNNSGSGDMDMPDFKPNNQKTKSLKKRLEIGTNLQTQKSNFFFPSTTDLGLSVGYKLNDKNIIGIGSSFKMGWGKNIQHVQLSGQGLSLRTFLDINIKNSFFVSGGLEYNYQKTFYDVAALYNIPAWKKSGLIGVSKMVSLKGKFLKKAKLYLLYDFFSKSQLPVTQAFKFRIGYSF